MKGKKINKYNLAAFLLVVAFIIVNLISKHNQSTIVQKYLEETPKETLEEQKKLSEKYNEALEVGTELAVTDVFTEEEVATISLFNSEEPFGAIEIPTIGVNIPLYEGTSERELQVGAGHMKGTSFPTGGENTRSVLTAHRGLSTKKMFRDLDKLKYGDIFFIDTYGEKKAYQVYEKEIVNPNDSSSIRLIEGKDVVTLLTCHPYMINSHRMLVNGERIPYNPINNTIVTKDGQEIKPPQDNIITKAKNLSFKDLVDIEYLILLIMILAFIISRIIVVLKRKKRQEYEDEYGYNYGDYGTYDPYEFYDYYDEGDYYDDYQDDNEDAY